jgi:uncharacterized protein
MKITLSLTHSCNLACDYCYAGRSMNRHMSFETARRAIDFAMVRTQPGEKIEIGFFGGEPLLRFEMIQKVVTYIHQQTERSPRQIVLSITTNGTILTDEILNFLEREAIDLCISIDGPKRVHDKHRVYRDGRGSFDDVFANLQWALKRLSRVQVNAVYSSDTLDFLPETVATLINTGVPSIHLNPNITAEWDKQAQRSFQRVYREVADLYIDSYRNGREIAINLIDNKIILFLKGGYSAQDMCGMGKTQWAFAPSGNIYPCERFIGEDDDDRFRLGNLYTGLDERRRVLIMHQAGNRNKECLTCELRPYCMNWCGCTNYYTTGRIDLAGPVLCASERAAIEAARYTLATLSGERCDLFITHMLNYFQPERHASIFPNKEVYNGREISLAG